MRSLGKLEESLILDAIIVLAEDARSDFLCSDSSPSHF